MRTILCLQYFRAADRHRQGEIDACLNRNLHHPILDGAVIWLEEGAPPLPPTRMPLEVRPLGRRLRFSDWLQLARESKDAIVLLCNADISLEGGFEALEQQLPQPEVALALTRHEPATDGEGGGIEPHPHWRQDCWAIRSDAPIDDSLLAAAALPLGRPGSDNRIAHVLWSHGFQLRNPASELRVLHHQRDRPTSYDRSPERLFGACTYVHPSPAGTEESELEHVIWSRRPEHSGQLLVQVEPRKGSGLVQPYQVVEQAVKREPEDGLVVHSTRLFPKHLGAEADQLSGIAERCDWVVLNAEREPRVQLRRREGISSPRHVFLPLREPFAALAFFEEEVLPQISSPFRLVSGSQNGTLPRQRIARILDDPRLLVWAAENLDQAHHSKWMPLPMGLASPDGRSDTALAVASIPPQSCRPLRLLCAHRLREGAQWEAGHRVRALCRRELAAWSTVLEEEVPEPQFLRLLHAHAFLLCVSGGGLDPSSKAWLAMLHGTIPIVRSSGLDAAYRELPVAIVEDWTAEALQPERLRAWQSRLAGLIDRPEGRAQTLERLGLEHWWRQITNFASGERAA